MLHSESKHCEESFTWCGLENGFVPTKVVFPACNAEICFQRNTGSISNSEPYIMCVRKPWLFHFHLEIESDVYFKCEHVDHVAPSDVLL